MILTLIGLILSVICFYIILWWWSECAVDTSDAILLVLVFCSLIICMFSAHDIWQFGLAFLLLAGAGAYIVHSYRIGGMRSYFKARCQEYMQVIQNDPRNLAAREFLGETLHNMGDLDRAIDEMQTAVDMGAGIECQFKLNNWLKERHLRDCTNPVCKWCQTENALGAKTCSRCGSALPYDSAFSRWLMSGRSAKSRCYLMAVVCVAIIAVSVMFLPWKLAVIPLLFCITALTGWVLISSARS